MAGSLPEGGDRPRGRNERPSSDNTTNGVLMKLIGALNRELSRSGSATKKEGGNRRYVPKGASASPIRLDLRSASKNARNAGGFVWQQEPAPFAIKRQRRSKSWLTGGKGPCRSHHSLEKGPCKTWRKGGDSGILEKIGQGE